MERKNIKQMKQLAEELNKNKHVLCGYVDIDNQITKLVEECKKAALPFNFVSKIINQNELCRTNSIFNNLAVPLRLANKSTGSIIYEDYESDRPFYEGCIMFSKNIEIEKENKKMETLQEIKALLEKDKDNIVLNSKKIIKQDEDLMQAKSWEEIEIKFDDKFTIKIYVNKNHIKTIDYEKIGFYGKGKDKKPNAEWEFLKSFSTISQLKKEEATKQAIKNSLENTLGMKIKDNYIEKIKSNLSKKLKEIFGLKDDPFYSYKDNGYYYSKFKIKPIPVLRGNGELYNFTGQYDDDIDCHQDEEE